MSAIEQHEKSWRRKVQPPRPYVPGQARMNRKARNMSLARRRRRGL